MASTGRDTEEASLSQPLGDAAKQHSLEKVGFSLDSLHPTGDSIQDLDWAQLQEDYANVMDNHRKVEEEVKTQTSNLLEIFMSWSQATLVHDETRALKRFKTQMQHVQRSEENLEKKRNHYINVVRAFESALALLNNRINQ